MGLGFVGFLKYNEILELRWFDLDFQKTYKYLSRKVKQTSTQMVTGYSLLNLIQISVYQN